jgi:signal transduction histidine kinase
MRERARTAGAAFTCRSEPGGGTCIELRFAAGETGA